MSPIAADYRAIGNACQATVISQHIGRAERLDALRLGRHIERTTETVYRTSSDCAFRKEEKTEEMGRTFSRQCPQCSNLVTWPDAATYPFCSERCRLIDLGMWASGDYRIPSDDPVEDENWSDESLWEDDETHC